MVQRIEELLNLKGGNIDIQVQIHVHIQMVMINENYSVSQITDAFAATALKSFG